jgi:subtilisin family serine protease
MPHRPIRSRNLLILLLVAACMAPDAGAMQSGPRRTPRAMSFAPHQIVVLAEEATLAATAAGAPRAPDRGLSGALTAHGLDRAVRLGPARRPGAAPRMLAWLLSSDRPGFDPVEAARALMATGAVRAASPNYRFGLLSTVPDDLFLIYQWYVDDSGFADVRLPQAWDLAQGDSNVVIAILDTGVDTTHPDLASKIWHNPGEIAGNALDDDGNGLVDDVEGWDFGTGDNDPKPEHTFDPSGIDVGFHGTFCAGIAAAATNNFEGIAGAGWKCRIMPVKISHPDSGITSDAIAAAMLYATDQGASVISMSFGGHGDPGVPEFFQALVDVATHAGALCVAAAGNDGDSTRVYPAACNQVLSVGATDFNNARASFSNWGPWVDVAAPGSYLWSTIAGNYELLLSDQLIYILVFGWDGVNPYMYGDGTSFACPLVAGVCGLVRAAFPSLTPHLVRQHIVASGDNVAFDLPVGPKLNAFAAVSGGPTAVAVVDRAPTRARVRAAPNPMSGAAAIRFELPTAGSVRLALFQASGRRVRTLVEGQRPAGSHVAAWDGRDDRGESLPGGIYFAKLEAAGETRSAKIALIRR